MLWAPPALFTFAKHHRYLNRAINLLKEGLGK